MRININKHVLYIYIYLYLCNDICNYKASPKPEPKKDKKNTFSPPKKHIFQKGAFNKGGDPCCLIGGPTQSSIATRFLDWGCWLKRAVR